MTGDKPAQAVDFEVLAFDLPPNAKRLRTDLRPGIVHLWRINLADADPPIGPIHNCLTEEEKTRAAKYRLAPDRNRYIATHAALQILLSVYLARPTNLIRTKTGEHGKPYITAPSTDLRFNLSHSGNWALIAFTRECEIGVDVERHREIRQLGELASRYLEVDAQKALSELESPQQNWAFLQYWTQFEAVLKARGIGIASRRNTQMHDCNAAIYSFSPAQDYVASLACCAAWNRLETFDGSGLIATNPSLP